MTQPALNTQVSELTPDSGLPAEGRQELARLLARGVADTYRLMIDTQGVHWNVQGPLFYSIHKLTEEQYRDMFEAAGADPRRYAQDVATSGSPSGCVPRWLRRSRTRT